MRATILNAPPGYIESLGLADDITLLPQPDNRADFIQVFRPTKRAASPRSYTHSTLAYYLASPHQSFMARGD